MKRPAPRYLLAAPCVLPVTAPTLECADGSCLAGVLVDGDCIAAVGTLANLAAGEDVPVVELPGCVLLPGLVNAHTHLELTGARALLAEPDFFKWLRQLVRAKANVLSPEDRLLAALAGAAELTAGGVTTCGDTCDGVYAAIALKQAGLGGIVYCEGFALSEGEVREGLEALNARLADARAQVAGSRVEVGVSPHAPYSVCAAMYRRVVELAAAQDLPLAVHLAESRAEVEFLTTGTGPFAQMYSRRGLRHAPFGSYPVPYVDLLGVLTARTLVIHAVQLADGDAELLAERGSSVAHCPRSNAFFGHGHAPLHRLRALGVPAGLGTDGACSSVNLDLFEEARFAWLAGRCEGEPAPTAADLLEMMTIEGARALGLQHETGSLEPGKRADIIAVELPALASAGVIDPVRALIETATSARVKLTVANGEWLYRDGRYAHFDPEPLQRAMRDQAVRIAAAQEATDVG